jgi:phospholipid/cholesterol/gamma-HCH transport system substrate-binding protein
MHDATGGALRLRRPSVREIVGLATVLALSGVVFICAALFRGDFTPSVPVMVLSSRAGLVMNPDAKVKMLGVQVGHVASIDALPDGRAALHLAIDPSQMDAIPSDVDVAISATTAFGSKYVQLTPPANGSAQSLQPGQVLQGSRVTVEINTVFQRLTSVLSAVEPGKLNATLAAISSALSGRGNKIGDAFTDLDALLARLEPSLPTLENDLQTMPAVVDAYADAAPDLTTAIANTVRVSKTVVEEQHNLDAVLVSLAGLGDVGTEVIGANRQPLADVLRLMVPTTDVLSRYHDALNCGLGGFIPVMDNAPNPFPGIPASLSLMPGVERYRYPSNLPKVAAKGDVHCADLGLPDLPFQGKPKFLVADIGANPWEYGNQGIVLNSDGLKQLLFGPVDGPPRNTAQIGQPG